MLVCYSNGSTHVWWIIDVRGKMQCYCRVMCRIAVKTCPTNFSVTKDICVFFYRKHQNTKIFFNELFQHAARGLSVISTAFALSMHILDLYRALDRWAIHLHQLSIDWSFIDHCTLICITLCLRNGLIFDIFFFSRHSVIIRHQVY